MIVDTATSPSTGEARRRADEKELFSERERNYEKFIDFSCSCALAKPAHSMHGRSVIISLGKRQR
jgi:hypothetical protein